MGQNYLKGEMGDRNNAVFAAAGYNFAKILAEFYCARSVWVYRLINLIQIALVQSKKEQLCYYFGND